MSRSAAVLVENAKVSTSQGHEFLLTAIRNRMTELTQSSLDYTTNNP